MYFFFHLKQKHQNWDKASDYEMMSAASLDPSLSLISQEYGFTATCEIMLAASLDPSLSLISQEYGLDRHM
jgi:hypothetical protein